MKARGRIIAADSDLETVAARIVQEKFLKAGQIASAPDYVLVQESQKNTFVAQLMLQTRHFYLANSYELNMERYCRIENDSHFERLRQLLQNAVKQGAAIVMGGAMDAAERIFHPTICTDLPFGVDLSSEKIMGPILFVFTYRDTDLSDYPDLALL